MNNRKWFWFVYTMLDVYHSTSVKFVTNCVTLVPFPTVIDTWSCHVELLTDDVISGVTIASNNFLSSVSTWCEVVSDNHYHIISAYYSKSKVWPSDKFATSCLMENVLTFSTAIPRLAFGHAWYCGAACGWIPVLVSTKMGEPMILPMAKRITRMSHTFRARFLSVAQQGLNQYEREVVTCVTIDI